MRSMLPAALGVAALGLLVTQVVPGRLGEGAFVVLAAAVPVLLMLLGVGRRRVPAGLLLGLGALLFVLAGSLLVLWWPGRETLPPARVLLVMGGGLLAVPLLLSGWLHGRYFEPSEPSERGGRHGKAGR